MYKKYTEWQNLEINKYLRKRSISKSDIKKPKEQAIL